jgi:uncharacterized protein with gpF-like domain
MRYTHHERKYYTLFRRALNKQVAPALEMLGAGAGEASVTGITIDPIKEVFISLYEDLVRKNAQSQYNELTKDVQKSTRDYWTLTADQFLRQYGTAKIVSITGTSRTFYLETVRRITQEVNAQGLGMYEAARMIEKEVGKAWADQTFYRAERIARTETATAANYATQVGAEATGRKDLRKIWKTSIDGRERDAHRAANRQQVAIDKPFTVGGESLMYPNDPNGSAGTVINCRCRQLVITPMHPEYNATT